MAKSKAEAPKPMTKSEILSGIAESTGLTKKDVGTVFDAMSEQITKAVAKRGPVFTPFLASARSSLSRRKRFLPRRT